MCITKYISSNDDNFFMSEKLKKRATLFFYFLFIYFFINYSAQRVILYITCSIGGIWRNGGELTRVKLERNVGRFVKRKEVAIFSVTRETAVACIYASFSLFLSPCLLVFFSIIFHRHKMIPLDDKRAEADKELLSTMFMQHFKFIFC